MNKLLEQDWLIIANGPLLSEDILHKLLPMKKIIALDGAIIGCINRSIIPDIVLGDFDSIDRNIIESMEKKYNIQFIFLPDQETSDLDKGITYISQFKPRSVTICQAIGARLDHTLHNLRLLKRLYSKVKNMHIITETEKMVFIKDKTVLIHAEDIEPVALMSFPKATVSSKGLKYDMDNYVLEFAKRESTSNHLINASARITVNGEALLIISHNTEFFIGNNN